MYSLPRIVRISGNDLDLPQCMYNLPRTQGASLYSEDEAVGTGTEAVTRLESRQIAILEKLHEIKAKVDKLLESAAQNSSGQQLREDVVVFTSTSNPPNALPLMCRYLIHRLGLKVFCSTHVHSTLTGRFPPELQDFLPLSSCQSRTEADLCLTLIWKKVGRDPIICLGSSVDRRLKGEAVLLRYLCQRFLGPAADLGSPEATKQEEMVDLIHGQAVWGRTGSETAILDRAVKAVSGSICRPSVLSLALFSSLQQSHLKQEAKYQDFLQSCEKMAACS